MCRIFRSGRQSITASARRLLFNSAGIQIIVSPASSLVPDCGRVSRFSRSPCSEDGKDGQEDRVDRDLNGLNAISVQF